MTKLKQLYKNDKPREKLAQKGAQSLKDHELLAILLGSGTKDKDVLKLSREIIKLFEKDFDTLNLEKLQDIHGLGLAKASQILSAIELSRRYLIKQNRRIKHAKDIYEELLDFTNKKQEYFIAITLDGASHIIDTRVIFIGTLNQTLVHPREIFAYAISDRAASIIIAHNHPSGELRPSLEDKLVTQRIHEVSQIMGIELLDHLIISKKGFYSFKEHNLL
ncbi:MAG: DNA repair protein RadC [Epsilonproteobacteria bacterium]|nr:DNA repair protein RadC [Campylobacterota bacterium]